MFETTTFTDLHPWAHSLDTKSGADESIDSADCSALPCPVCGFSAVRSDAVLHRGLMLLAECPRCDHRWTWADQRVRTQRGVITRVSPESGREFAGAA